MGLIRVYGGSERGRRKRSYDFTVLLTPVFEGAGQSRARKSPNPMLKREGFQVTVPLLPGIITYGRTEKEALEMARDAILCHVQGLQKAGEPIPDERQTRTEKLRIAI